MAKKCKDEGTNTPVVLKYESTNNDRSSSFTSLPSPPSDIEPTQEPSSGQPPPNLTPSRTPSPSDYPGPSQTQTGILRNHRLVTSSQRTQEQIAAEPQKQEKNDKLRSKMNSLKRNDDLSLPKATVQKIVGEILSNSPGMGLTKDARDLLIECCVEFITLISSEANEISEKESKKTIACEHITKALEQLGFGDYVHDIMEVASEHKEQLKGREKKANKLEQSGLSTEQLLAMQEAAFKDAAQRHG